LDVSFTGGFGNEGTAIVSPKTNSTLYSGNDVATTYYTSGSISMTLSKYVIKAGETSVATFAYRGATPGSNLTYTCPSIATAPAGIFSFTGSTLTYSTGANDFTGGSYEIIGTYILDSTHTYVARSVVFAQPNILTGNLSLSTPNLSPGKLTTTGYAYSENGGSAITTNMSFTCIGNAAVTGTKNNEGLTFNTGTGILT
jgi:hypothetical protein